MKDRIVKMVRVLWALIRPPESGHHAVYRHTTSPAQGRHLSQTLRSPWMEPWTSPDCNAVRQLWADDERDMTIPLTPVRGDLPRGRAEFRQSLDRAPGLEDLFLQQERQRALKAAAEGRDYPYSYPGGPFPSYTIGTT